MRTFSSIRGLPVFLQQTGAKIGVIEEVCIDEAGNVKGFIIDVEGFLKRDRYLPFEKVSAVGRDGIIVAYTQSAFHRPVLQPNEHHLHDPKKGVWGKSLYTTEGEKLGMIADVYFQEELGKITGYQVSDGFFADVTEGKKRIPAYSTCSIGEEAVFITCRDDMSSTI
ncbi:PRC-barrel domain-containing protein [Bacillus tianshenii]|nr:PRC-barrel domain-containing protein [Bacillus tianshenii]